MARVHHGFPGRDTDRQLALVSKRQLALAEKDDLMLSRIGFLIFLGVLPGIPLAVAITDLTMTRRGRQPVGYYLNQFVVGYPWFAGILAAVFGAMIAHFFLHIAHG
jgi:hypothetical protein